MSVLTPTSVKAEIDSVITNKTLAYSIDNEEVGGVLKDMVDLFTEVQFTSTALRIAYLTNPAAQPFQLVDDLQDGNKYYINKTGDAWVQIANGLATNNIEIIQFSGQSSMIIAWDSTRQQKFGAAASFTIETLDDDGKYRVKSGLEIYPDSIVTTTSYHIDFGGTNQTGRITIK